jgi:hypothetical protein
MRFYLVQLTVCLAYLQIWQRQSQRSLEATSCEVELIENHPHATSFDGDSRDLIANCELLDIDVITVRPVLLVRYSILYILQLATNVLQRIY